MVTKAELDLNRREQLHSGGWQVPFVESYEPAAYIEDVMTTLTSLTSAYEAAAELIGRVDDLSAPSHGSQERRSYDLINEALYQAFLIAYVRPLQRTRSNPWWEKRKLFMEQLVDTAADPELSAAHKWANDKRNQMAHLDREYMVPQLRAQFDASGGFTQLTEASSHLTGEYPTIRIFIRLLPNMIKAAEREKNKLVAALEGDCRAANLTV